MPIIRQIITRCSWHPMYHGQTVSPDQSSEFFLFQTAARAEKKAEATGYLRSLKKNSFDLHLHYLSGITNILKLFSLRFQESFSSVNDYVALVGCLQFVLSAVDLVNAPSPALQYWFSEYYATLSIVPQLHTYQRASRLHPNFGTLADQQRVIDDLATARTVHQDHINDMVAIMPRYWYGDHRWWPETANILPNVGNWLSSLEDQLGINFVDPLSPTEGRCSSCSAHVKKDNRERGGHKHWTLHKKRLVNGSQPCLNATLDIIPSLSSGFIRDLSFDPLTLRHLSYYPTHVTNANLDTLVHQLRLSRQALIRKKVPVTLHSCVKQLMIESSLVGPVAHGVRHLVLSCCCMAHSEAICETLGSMVEDYHTQRFTNQGAYQTDDDPVHRELFVRLNMPPLHECAGLAKKMVRLMVSGRLEGHLQRRFKFGTQAYLSGGWQNSLVSPAVKRLMESKEGRKGILERF